MYLIMATFVEVGLHLGHLSKGEGCGRHQTINKQHTDYG